MLLSFRKIIFMNIFLLISLIFVIAAAGLWLAFGEILRNQAEEELQLTSTLLQKYFKEIFLKENIRVGAQKKICAQIAGLRTKNVDDRSQRLTDLSSDLSVMFSEQTQNVTFVILYDSHRNPLIWGSHARFWGMSSPGKIIQTLGDFSSREVQPPQFSPTNRVSYIFFQEEVMIQRSFEIVDTQGDTQGYIQYFFPIVQMLKQYDEVLSSQLNLYVKNPVEVNQHLLEYLGKNNFNEEQLRHIQELKGQVFMFPEELLEAFHEPLPSFHQKIITEYSQFASAKLLYGTPIEGINIEFTKRTNPEWKPSYVYIMWPGDQRYAYKLFPIGKIGMVGIFYDQGKTIQGFMKIIQWLVIFFVMTILASLICTSFMASWISRPLVLLCEQIAQLNVYRGDTLKYTSRIKEFMEISAAVGEMAQGIMFNFHLLTEEIEQHQQVQKGLARSEHQFREVLESSTDGIGIFIGPKMVYGNARFFEILNKPRIQMDSLAVESVLGKALQQKVTSGQTMTHTWQHDGLWLEGDFRRIYWDGEVAAIGVIRDVSHLKNQELVLEDRLKKMHDNMLRAMQGNQFGSMVGRSPAMQTLYRQILQCVQSEELDRILILGETGTGKELVAQTLHQMSGRTGKFHTVNCGAIPESLFESEFFGHKKGAFTGADQNKEGHLDAAQDGTLFLDEIGELSLGVQAKLLRVLQNREYTPVGSQNSKVLTCQVVSATHRNIKGMIAKKQFRQDLYYRLDMPSLTIPPLRDRREDIPLLIDFFLQKIKFAGTFPATLTAEWVNWEWPGNVRELENEIRKYAAGIISEQDVQQASSSLSEQIEEFERLLIQTTLKKMNGERKKTADFLHVNRKTLYRKLQKYGLDESNGTQSRK